MVNSFVIFNIKPPLNQNFHIPPVYKLCWAVVNWETTESLPCTNFTTITSNQIQTFTNPLHQCEDKELLIEKSTATIKIFMSAACTQ